LRARISDEGDAVVFIVVLKECHDIVLEDDCGAEEGGPEVDHALEVGGAEDDVGEGDGADYFAAAGLSATGLGIWDGHGEECKAELGEELWVRNAAWRMGGGDIPE
jgi:hypothetical protein